MLRNSNFIQQIKIKNSNFIQQMKIKKLRFAGFNILTAVFLDSSGLVGCAVVPLG
jgi:hypothetical protein